MVENIYDQQKSEINICLIDEIGSDLNNVMASLQDDIQENKIGINNTRKNLKELTKNNISINNRNVNNYENIIRIRKINELNQRKKNIQKQISKIEENIKIINDEQIFYQPNKLNINMPILILEKNINNDRIKENRYIKELLFSKLNEINEQVNKLMENEAELNYNKKLNVKEFLENLEKDKKKKKKELKKY